MLNTKTNLSDIKDLASLHRAIDLMKVQVKLQEDDLADRWKRVPKESLKASVGAVVPAFISNKLGIGLWQVVKIGSSLLFSGKAQSSPMKSGFWKNIRNAGFFAIAKAAFNLWKGRR